MSHNTFIFRLLKQEVCNVSSICLLLLYKGHYRFSWLDRSVHVCMLIAKKSFIYRKKYETLSIYAVAIIAWCLYIFLGENPTLQSFFINREIWPTSWSLSMYKFQIFLENFFSNFKTLKKSAIFHKDFLWKISILITILACLYSASSISWNFVGYYLITHLL